MGGENALRGPAGMVELQGLPDSWIMRVLSSAGKEKTKSVKRHTFPNTTKIFKIEKVLKRKTTLYCYEVSAKVDDRSRGFTTYKYK